MMRSLCLPLLVTSLTLASPTNADSIGTTSAATPVTYSQALSRAGSSAPDLRVAKWNESAALSSVRVAGALPNPTFSFGSATQAAKLSTTISVPLPILGQIGAGKDAARAEAATVNIEGEMTAVDVRAEAARAFVSLWLAERTATLRQDTADIHRKLEAAVKGRVEVGTAPNLEYLRVKAERLRVEADAIEAERLTAASSARLGRWLGGTGAYRTVGDPEVPAKADSLSTLLGRASAAPVVRRETSDAAAAEARADHERALVRPMLTLDLGADFGDPTLPGTNWRAAIGIEVPLLSWRGPHIAREKELASAAHARAAVAEARTKADVSSAYASFTAASARLEAIEAGVLPVSEEAAKEAEESYALGKATLLVVLDAERARLDARQSKIDTQAARANAWITLQQLLGVR